MPIHRPRDHEAFRAQFAVASEASPDEAPRLRREIDEEAGVDEWRVAIGDYCLILRPEVRDAVLASGLPEAVAAGMKG